MEDCTRVLVYGSFDGFAYSTDDSIAISVVLDSGEKSRNTRRVYCKRRSNDQ